MGRNKSYNEQDVLTILAREFSNTGYEGTSIDQIEKATGMKRGSIYQAFDSKANLFRLAFQATAEAKADIDLMADLLVVALWERAGVDQHVRSVAGETIEYIESSTGDSIEQVLWSRLKHRAGLEEQS